MSREELLGVIRVCGPNFEKSDIPAYIRRRDRIEFREINIPIVAYRSESAEQQNLERLAK